MATGDERRYRVEWDAKANYGGVRDNRSGDKLFAGDGKDYNAADRLRHELERSWEEMQSGILDGSGGKILFSGSSRTIAHLHETLERAREAGAELEKLRAENADLKQRAEEGALPKCGEYQGRGYYQDGKTGKVVYIAEVGLSDGLLTMIRKDDDGLTIDGGGLRLAVLIDDVQAVIDQLRPPSCLGPTPDEICLKLCRALKKARGDADDGVCSCGDPRHGNVCHRCGVVYVPNREAADKD